MSRLLFGALFATIVSTAHMAAADPIADAARAAAAAQALAHQAEQLLQTAHDIRDLLYYASDPRGFQHDFYQVAAVVQGDPVLGPLVHNLADLYRHPTWTVTTRAAAMADSATPASASVGAAVTLDVPLCRLFEAQGSAQGFYEDRDASAALAWGIGGCLPLPFDTFSLGYRGRRQVRTSLLSVPIIDGDRQSGDTVYADLRFYRWLSAGHQIDVGPIAFQFDWARGDSARSFQSWASFSPAHWARRGKGYGGRDQTYDFMRVSFTTLGIIDDGIDDPLTAAFSPLAIDGIKIGDRVALGLDLGWGLAEVIHGVTDVKQHTALNLDASMVGAVGPAVAELHVKNTMQPTISNQVLDEDRVTVRIDLDRTAAWLRADGFASHVRLIDANRYTPKVWTYGAGADATFALTSRVYLYGRIEGARGIVVDESPGAPATRLDVRGTAGVTTQLQRTY